MFFFFSFFKSVVQVRPNPKCIVVHCVRYKTLNHIHNRGQVGIQSKVNEQVTIYLFIFFPQRISGYQFTVCCRHRYIPWVLNPVSDLIFSLTYLIVITCSVLLTDMSVFLNRGVSVSCSTASSFFLNR